MSLASAFGHDCRAISDGLRGTLMPLVALAALFGVSGTLSPARAQVIVETVNGRPITDIDIAQRQKLLKVLRKPTGREAAIQSLVDDQLELQETSQYGIKPTDTQIGQEVVRTAQDMKIPAQTLFAELQHSGVSENHFKEHFSAQVAFLGLMQAFQKGVEASETEVRAELAKEGDKVHATEYRIHQVIFTLPATKTMEIIKGRVAAADQLRTRFSDCASGLPLARNMDNVAVKEEIVTNSAKLSEGLRQMFDKTPAGHLTAPQRTTDGIEMIAICSKSTTHDDTAERTAISERLLAGELKQNAERRLKELREHAIIVKK